MFRHRTGTAGCKAGGLAAARYFLGETLRPDNDLLAQYYAGESVPQDLDGIDHLGRAIKDGDIGFSAAACELIAAHGRMFGYPDDIDGLETRISDILVKAADRAEMRETLAAEGGTVARIREDLDPRLAERLGIDIARPLTQGELANLLSGTRADGQAIEGKQIQRPTKSIAEVFGLDAAALPAPAAIDHILAGQRADGDVPRSAEGNGAPLSETVIDGARKRFLNAYGLPSGTKPTAEHIAHMKAGRTATGRFLDTGDVLRHLAATKAPISYTDCIWSADKSVSVAWALAPTERERALIHQAHRESVAESMAYAETHLGVTRKTRGAEVTWEPGTTAWIVCDHYTARPTAEIAMRDKSGEVYTEFQTVPLRVADMQLHSHALLLNAVLTESGRIGAMDLDRLDGKVKEFGGVYQATYARKLRALGIDARLDPETGACRVMDVPAFVTRHFSKRTQDIEKAAHRYAADEGLDWDAMTPAHRLKFLRRGVEETRLPKRAGEGDSDFTIWRKEAEEVGYRHRSVLRPGQEQGLRPEAERLRHAYEVSLPLIEDALAKRAKLSAGEFREFATRGLIEAGIGDDPGADIKAVMGFYQKHGVRQNGELTRIIFGEDVPVRGKQRWSVTTQMHVEDEETVISLAQRFAADKSGALSPDALERASQEFLAKNPQIDRDGAQWARQREVIEMAGTGPMFCVVEGVGGAGKSTLLSPIVAASREAGRDVHGVARGWKQAVSLRSAGLTQKDVAAVSVFLDRANKGRITLGKDSTVIVEELSQVGRPDMLKLLQLQQRHGFRMLAIGDPKQGGAIDPEVIDLLVETLGDKVPKILTSVRQNTERERTISRLFRDGHAGEAIRLKREDRTAELVAGGRAATIRRIAEKWHELTLEGREPTIGTALNKDAHDIGVAIRQRLQEAGAIGRDAVELPVLRRGEADVQPMPLAAGDKVRVFNRIWLDRRHFASNGDVLTVLAAGADGMTARNEDGREAFVPWSKCRAGFDAAPRLAYGHALTIDASQGTTGRVHIDAVLSGSWCQQGGKGYVNESRQVETTYLIVNEAAERRRIYSRMTRGEHQPIHAAVREADIWKHVAANISRPSTKASALEFLQVGSNIRRGSLTALMAVRPGAPAREQEAGRLTPRHRMELVKVAIDLPRLAMEGMRHVQQRIQQYRGPRIGL
nr:MobF family relaxase [uncultured Rhodopila sp.]